VERRIERANAEYQVLRSLLGNRQKRHQRRQFLIQGVRPLTCALEAGWRLKALIRNSDIELTTWAKEILERAHAPVTYMVAQRLMAELAGKEGPVELLAVGEMPDRQLSDFRMGANGVVVAIDRPANPGNLGTIIRSADAFGAAAVVTLGHGADPYDPQCIRASTGSLFATTVISAASMTELQGWIGSSAPQARIVAASEDGRPLADVDLSPPLVLLLGSEGRGLSRRGREVASDVAAIPMQATAASSLNVASAAAVLLYEVRRRHPSDPGGP
jgi:TrmH family RNA methyltransferase